MSTERSASYRVTAREAVSGLSVGLPASSSQAGPRHGALPRATRSLLREALPACADRAQVPGAYADRCQACGAETGEAGAHAAGDSRLRGSGQELLPAGSRDLRFRSRPRGFAMAARGIFLRADWTDANHMYMITTD